MAFIVSDRALRRFRWLQWILTDLGLIVSNKAYTHMLNATFDQFRSAVTKRKDDESAK